MKVRIRKSAPQSPPASEQDPAPVPGYARARSLFRMLKKRPATVSGAPPQVESPTNRPQKAMPGQLNEALKGTPIANKPGLYFDQTAHRWKHAPFDHEEGDDEEMRGYIAAENRHAVRAAERRNRVHEAVEDGHLEFKHHSSDHHAVVLPDATEPGRWRVSHYDERGFSGHRTFDGRHDAVADMAKDGYHVPAKGSLDRLASSQTWARGTRDTAVSQLWNAAGSREAKPAIDRWYDGSAEAHDRLMSAGVSDALRRGDVPEEIVKSISHLGTVALSVVAALTPPRIAAAPLAWEA